MAGKDLKDAAEKFKKRQEILKTPVMKLPYAPGNNKLTKAEFIAQRAKMNEEALAVEAFKKEFRAKKESEKPVEAPEETEKRVKRGRPKKVD